MEILTTKDYLLLPIYLFIIYFIGVKVRKHYYPPGHSWRLYFMPALMLKVLASLALCFYYRYYYGNGDIMKYFHTASLINSSFADSPHKWYNLITVQASVTDPAYKQYFDVIDWYGIRCLNMYIVSIIASIIGILTFNTFLNTSIIFAAISFTGMWALFRTFASRYPALLRYVAMSILFIPSVILWGSSLSKDTICMFALGWIIHLSFKVFQQRRLRIYDFLLFLISITAMLLVKPYIFWALAPALLYWAIMSATKNTKNTGRKYLLRTLILGLVVGLLFIIPKVAPSFFGKYSVYNFIDTSENTRQIIAQTSLKNPGSSAYDLGDIEPTPGSLLRKSLPAINAALFRPYIWENSKPIVISYALESLALLIITFFVIVRRGPVKIWNSIKNDIAIQFCLLFSLAFAFSVGISTYNFGTLSRYRIPCLPFYGLALVLIYFSQRSNKRDSVKEINL